MNQITTIQLYSTQDRQKVDFKPIQPDHIKLYACGPTVYNRAHIGNLRTYIFEDCLVRMFRYFGYHVQHVMNITDVGHLESDADDGDDKMTKAAEKMQKSPWDIAREFEDLFFIDGKDLNINRPDIVCRATDHIDGMIDFIQKLEAKGFVYVADGNVYFDTEKLPDYGRLIPGFCCDHDNENEDAAATATAESDDAAVCNQDHDENYSRVDADHRKKNQKDFVLWFSNSKFPNQIMQWDSPWGRGFPGWHIECSVMATQYLGEHFDIHCGGIDHIPIHHTNEIAQSEALFCHNEDGVRDDKAKSWVNYWLHGEFLVVDKGKMSKSKGNFLSLDTLRENGFDPMHYRYLCLMAHYRSQLKFSFDSLKDAKNSFENMKNRVLSWKSAPAVGKKKRNNPELMERCEGIIRDFNAAIADDLNMPVALACFWKMAKDKDLPDGIKYELAQKMDDVFGFGMVGFEKPVLGDALMCLITEREQARSNKDFAKSDALRDQILHDYNLILMDRPDGSTDWYFSV